MTGAMVEIYDEPIIIIINNIIIIIIIIIIITHHSCSWDNSPLQTVPISDLLSPNIWPASLADENLRWKLP